MQAVEPVATIVASVKYPGIRACAWRESPEGESMYSLLPILINFFSLLPVRSQLLWNAKKHVRTAIYLAEAVSDHNVAAD